MMGWVQETDTRVFHWLQAAGFVEANQPVSRLVSQSLLLRLRTWLDLLCETGKSEFPSSQALASVERAAGNLMLEGTLRTGQDL